MMKTEDLIKDLSRFPLLEALFGRRSRRFGLGMEIPSGPLQYTSRHEAVDLTPLERAVLLVCGCGVSGWNAGLEHTASANPKSGCNYAVRHTGRTFASGAGALSAELMVTDDSGTFITKFRDIRPDSWRQFENGFDAEKFLQIVGDHSVKLSDGRVVIPNELPHVPSHNQWSVGKSGTTLFVPVVDMTVYMLNLIGIYLGMGFIPYDTTHDRPCGDLLPHVRSGTLNEVRRFPLCEIEQHVLASCAIEAGQICHNLVLTLQAMGLGGWMFTGLNSYSLLGSSAEQGIPGFGFRFQRDERWPSPNPVGIDGHFEALCPPYQRDMKAAVESFIKMKFGEGGTYDPKKPGPFRENARIKNEIERYSPEMVEILTKVATYIFETYGKFPSSVSSIYSRPCVQAQHIDHEYYDKFYGSDSYLESHRDHMCKWHSQG